MLRGSGKCANVKGLEFVTSWTFEDCATAPANRSSAMGRGYGIEFGKFTLLAVVFLSLD